MSRNGYATLAVDKLGNGASSHPDSVYDVQLPLQMETAHADQDWRCRRSYPSGSILGACLAQTHPDDLDVLDLAGYSAGGANSKGGIPSYHYLPAAISAPTRFPSNLSYGYLLMNSNFDSTSAFYYKGYYDLLIPHLNT